MRPGDRVEVVGIYRAQGVKVKKARNNLKSVFNTYVDLISFNVIEDNRYKAVLGDENTVFSDDEKLKFSENVCIMAIEFLIPSSQSTNLTMRSIFFTRQSAHKTLTYK